MKITKRQLNRYIKRMLSERAPLKDPLAHKDPADVIHATHAAWAGGNAGEVEDENLVLPIDHSVAAGGEPTTKEPEMLPRQEDLVSERQLRMVVRKILSEVMAAEESYPAIDEYEELRSKGDNALRSYMGFMSRATTADLEKLGQLWDGIVAAPGDPKGAQELAKSLGFTSPGIVGAGSFHARKIKPGTEYPAGAELVELITNYRDQIAKKRAANPPPPRPRKPYGGGTRNRPYDRST